MTAEVSLSDYNLGWVEQSGKRIGERLKLPRLTTNAPRELGPGWSWRRANRKTQTTAGTTFGYLIDPELHDGLITQVVAAVQNATMAEEWGCLYYQKFWEWQELQQPDGQQVFDDEIGHNIARAWKGANRVARRFPDIIEQRRKRRIASAAELRSIRTGIQAILPT